MTVAPGEQEEVAVTVTRTTATLGTWTEHFEPLPGASFDAQPYEVNMPAQAIDFEPGEYALLCFLWWRALASVARISVG